MYRKHQLSNGLKVIVSPMPYMTSVSIGIWIGVGGRYEPAPLSGISHLVEHMLFKGTINRGAKELKQAIEGIGGILNGFTADEATCYMVKVPTRYQELGLDILTDMVFNSVFDYAEIVKEKNVICEEIKMYKDQPAERAVEMLAKTMWPDNPLGRPLTGTITTVKGISRNEMMNFCKKNYSPSNMAVIVTGKVNERRMLSYISKNYTGKKLKGSQFIKARLDQKKERVNFGKGDTKQAHIAMGFPVGEKNMRLRFATKLMNVILGGNMSSRLFEELREKYGLCYDIASSYKRHSDVGDFVIHAGVDNSKALMSVIAILDELRSIRDMGVTDDELTRAKDFAKGQFALSMENTTARMIWYGDRLMIDGKIPETRELLDNIDSVTKEDIRRACWKIFRSGLLNLAVVGNLSQKMKDNIRKEIKSL